MTVSSKTGGLEDFSQLYQFVLPVFDSGNEFVDGFEAFHGFALIFPEFVLDILPGLSDHKRVFNSELIKFYVYFTPNSNKIGDGANRILHGLRASNGSIK